MSNETARAELKRLADEYAKWSRQAMLKPEDICAELERRQQLHAAIDDALPDVQADPVAFSFLQEFIGLCELCDINANMEPDGYGWKDLYLRAQAMLASLPLPARPVAQWISVSERLPPCDGETVFIGVNTNGYVCCFNAIDSRGNCVMKSPEDSVTHMSGLKSWMPLPGAPQ